MLIAIYRGIKDGINYSRGKPLQYNEKYNVHNFPCGNVQNIVHDEREQYKIEQLESELLMLETIVKRDNYRAMLLEQELKKAPAKRRETILNKLNTLDRQTYKNKTRIDQIKDLLSN